MFILLCFVFQANCYLKQGKYQAAEATYKKVYTCVFWFSPLKCIHVCVCLGS